MSRKGIKKGVTLRISVPIVYIAYMKKQAIYSAIKKLWPVFSG